MTSSSFGSSSSRRTACITGASKGIGAALAFRLAREGYDVALVARSGALLERLAEDIRAGVPGAKVGWAACDVTDWGALEGALDGLQREVGPFSVVVNNAGMSEMVALQHQSPESVQQMVAVNFTSAALVSAYALKHWCRAKPTPLQARASPPRTLLSIASVAGIRLMMPALALYVATKQALIGLSLATLEDVREYNIKVSCICPGLVNTELGDQFREDYFREHSHLPKEQFLQPDDISEAVLYVLRSSHTVVPYLLVLEPQPHARREMHLASLHGRHQLHYPAPSPPSRRPVALVTGASRGIGRFIATWLSRQGYDLVLLARSLGGLQATAALCSPAALTECVIVDVADLKALEVAVEKAAVGFARGRLEVVVSNAGLNKRNSAIRGRPVFEEVLQTNLLAASVLTRTALCYMPKRAGPEPPPTAGEHLPTIIYVGSNYAREVTIGVTGQGPYIASKMGLLGLANSVFADVRDYGIRVVSLLPGLVATELGERPPPESLGMTTGELISAQDILDALDYALLRCSSTCCPTHIYMSNSFYPYDSIRSIAQRFSDSKL